mmetsp:Transcript_22335/g.69094  ORF Transcript_22335/g.69094 Transcript_22335/m.69094 type:complete len:203 (-) Transcript_22335:1802-2410(-)
MHDTSSRILAKSRRSAELMRRRPASSSTPPPPSCRLAASATSATRLSNLELALLATRFTALSMRLIELSLSPLAAEEASDAFLAATDALANADLHLPMLAGDAGFAGESAPPPMLLLASSSSSPRADGEGGGVAESNRAAGASGAAGVSSIEPGVGSCDARPCRRRMAWLTGRGAGSSGALTKERYASTTRRTRAHVMPPSR